LQNPEEVVEFDTVPNVKKQHEVNVGEYQFPLTLTSQPTSSSPPSLYLLIYCFAGISNSFGFGGHNSVVVFAPFKP
jgi:3-oxoacyl-[acyl-carrier-protein] synthase II